jgi:murein L,D-transpeptidase YcbB/YkuD
MSVRVGVCLLVMLGACAPAEPQSAQRIVLPAIWDFQSNVEAVAATPAAEAQPPVEDPWAVLEAAVRAPPESISVEAGGPEIGLEIPVGSVTNQLAGGEFASLTARLEAYYEANGHHPLFLDPHYGSGPANSMLQMLLAIHELGLDPFDYHFATAMELAGKACRVHFSEPDEVVAALEAKLATYIPDALPPLVTLDCDGQWWPGDEAARKLDITLALAWLRLGDVLHSDGLVESFPGAEQAVPALVAWLPASERYWGKVAALRGFMPHWARGTFPVLGKWGGLKRGDFGPRVARLKRRLVVEGFLKEDAAKGHWKTFDKVTRNAVLAYRDSYGLRAKGNVDKAMLDQLSLDADVYVQRVWASLHATLVEGREREANYILVNIPEFKTYLVQHGRVEASYRSVVGFPYQESGGRTPELNAKVKYVDLNPTWTPTPWVVENELKRKASKASGYYAENGFEKRGGKLVQLPGPENTLGQVVIGFPNENNISLHGTNEPKRFNYADRALSHGCVRVENIEELAERILNWADQRPEMPLENIFKKVVERRVVLARELPVYIVYDPVAVVSGATVALTQDPYKLHRHQLKKSRLDSLLKVVAMARAGRRLAER